MNPETQLRTVVSSVDKVALTELIWWAVGILVGWMFVSWAKEKITAWWDKKEVISGTVLSDNSYYRINGCEGYLRNLQQSKDRITLEEHFTDGKIHFHHVPMEKVIHGTITKLSPPMMSYKKED